MEEAMRPKGWSVGGRGYAGRGESWWRGGVSIMSVDCDRGCLHTTHHARFFCLYTNVPVNSIMLTHYC